MLRLIDYPPYSGAPRPGQLRAGAHTDLNMLTVLHANSTVGGLEVRDRNATGSRRRCTPTHSWSTSATS